MTDVKSYELSEELVDNVVNELIIAIACVSERLTQDGLDGEEIVPEILLPLSVKLLSFSRDPEFIMEFLDSIHLQVERGDFHQGQDGQQSPPRM